MAPPSYSDLGKACRDVFSKGYNFGVFRLSTCQTTCGGVDIKSDVSHTFEDASFNASVETKYPLQSYGLTWINRWLSNNFLFSGLHCQDAIAPGVKVGVEGLWAPETGEKSGKFLSQYKMANATIDLDVNGDEKSSVGVNGSVVLGYEGWLAGGQGLFDLAEGGLKTSSFAIGHSYQDVQTLIACENLDIFKGSIYHRISNRFESGIQFGWSSSGETPKSFGVAGRYLTDPCSSIRAKFTNESKLGIGYESQVRPGVTLSFSADLNLKSFNEGGHQFGIGLELEQ